MPELPEVEAYRVLAETALGRPVKSLWTPDLLVLRRGATVKGLRASFSGTTFVGARRRGKLLILDSGYLGESPARPGVDGAAVSHRLGIRFGMTGRLVVDGLPGVDRLLYSSDRHDPAWDRFAVRFVDGGSLVLHDPRRLGGVEIDPDEESLGPDALSITLAELRHALKGRQGSSRVALKAALLDQSRIAGVGNLVADEALWRAGLDPLRPSGFLTDPEVRILHRTLRSTLRMLIRRGGSHLGDLVPERRVGGRCPRDGSSLSRSKVGGRTTWWCPRHQH